MLLKNPRMDGSHVPKARERIRQLQEELRKQDDFLLTVYRDSGGNVQVHAAPEVEWEEFREASHLDEEDILFQFEIEGQITGEPKVTNY